MRQGGSQIITALPKRKGVLEMIEKMIKGSEFIKYLCELLGIKHEFINRIVIDVRYDGCPSIQIERSGTTALLGINFDKESELKK
jgi:hypothetical protein